MEILGISSGKSVCRQRKDRPVLFSFFIKKSFCFVSRLLKKRKKGSPDRAGDDENTFLLKTTVVRSLVVRSEVYTQSAVEISFEN